MTDYPDFDIQRHPLIDKDHLIKGTFLGMKWSIELPPDSKLARIFNILSEPDADDVFIPDAQTA